jgi:hypothetical protein
MSMSTRGEQFSGGAEKIGTTINLRDTNVNNVTCIVLASSAHQASELNELPTELQKQAPYIFLSVHPRPSEADSIGSFTHIAWVVDPLAYRQGGTELDAI